MVWETVFLNNPIKKKNGLIKEKMCYAFTMKAIKKTRTIQ